MRTAEDWVREFIHGSPSLRGRILPEGVTGVAMVGMLEQYARDYGGKIAERVANASPYNAPVHPASIAREIVVKTGLPGESDEPLTEW